jgi:hypothetical protein
MVLYACNAGGGGGAAGGDAGQTAPGSPASNAVPTITDTTAPTDPSNLAHQSEACLYRSEKTTFDSSTDAGIGINRYEAALSTTNTEAGIISGFSFTKGVVTEAPATNTVQWTGSGVKNLSANTDYYTLVKAIDHAGNASNTVASAAWQIPTDHPIAHLTATETLAPANPTNFNQATAYQIKWSASTVDSCHFSNDTGGANPERLNFTYAGDYFVSLTVPLTLADVDAIRRSVIGTIFKNGTAITEAFTAPSYIRQSSGHAEASLHLAIVLPGIVAGDYIEVYVQLKDQAGTVTTTAATLYVEYIKKDRNIFYATGDNTAGGLGINLAVPDVVEWTEVIEDTPFAHDDASAPDEITITNSTTKDYLTFINMPLDGGAGCTGADGNDRRAPQLQLQVDAATITGGYASQGYIRCTASHDQSSLHFSALARGISTGNVMRVSALAEGTDFDDVNVPTSTTGSLFIEEIDNATPTDIISLSGVRTVASTNWNSSIAGSEVQWDTSYYKDAAEFTHNIAASNHQITVVTGGDFLVIYNDHLILGSSSRNNPIVNIQVNGGDVTGGQCKTHYQRNSQGSLETTCSLVFPLLNLNAADIITFLVKREASSGTMNDASPALLTIVKKDD